MPTFFIPLSVSAANGGHAGYSSGLVVTWGGENGFALGTFYTKEMGAGLPGISATFGITSSLVPASNLDGSGVFSTNAGSVGPFTTGFTRSFSIDSDNRILPDTLTQGPFIGIAEGLAISAAAGATKTIYTDVWLGNPMALNKPADYGLPYIALSGDQFLQPMPNTNVRINDAIRASIEENPADRARSKALEESAGEAGEAARTNGDLDDLNPPEIPAHLNTEGAGEDNSDWSDRANNSLQSPGQSADDPLGAFEPSSLYADANNDVYDSFAGSDWSGANTQNDGTNFDFSSFNFNDYDNGGSDYNYDTSTSADYGSYDYSNYNDSYYDSSAYDSSAYTDYSYASYDTGYSGYDYGGFDMGWPVLLDLDGTDGVEITPLTSSNVYMDMAGDGYQHRTAWAGSGDGVLVYDVGNDGIINQRNEIVFTDWDASAGSDFEALKSAFDSNNDSILSAADANFANFKIMKTNADGSDMINIRRLSPRRRSACSASAGVVACKNVSRVSWRGCDAR